MDALDLFLHLLNFTLPAFGTAAIMATLAKLLWRRALGATRWTTLAGRCAAAGLAVLLGGLLITGHDGRMATYAALVIACALVPWWLTLRR